MLPAAVIALSVLTAASSLPLARRLPAYRPAAAFLAAAAVANVARAALRATAPGLALARVPSSTSRLALHVDQALCLVWPAGLAALALAVCLARRSRPAVLAWAGAVALLAGLSLRGALAAELHAAAHIAADAFALGALVQWSGRGRYPGPAHLALVGIVTFDTLAFVATRGGDVGALWPSALSCYFVLYVCLTVMQGVAWVRSTLL